MRLLCAALVLAAPLVNGARSSKGPWRGLRAAYNAVGGADATVAYREADDAHRIENLFDKAMDETQAWEPMSTRSSWELKDRFADSEGNLRDSDASEELSRSSDAFTKFAKDFEKSTEAEDDPWTGEQTGLSTDRQLQARRERLEREGNFQAASEVNAFSSPFEDDLEAEKPQSSYQKLAEDVSSFATDSDSPFVRLERKRKQQARAEKEKEELKAEDATYTFDSEMFAYENMVKKEEGAQKKSRGPHTKSKPQFFKGIDYAATARLGQEEPDFNW